MVGWRRIRISAEGARATPGAVWGSLGTWKDPKGLPNKLGWATFEPLGFHLCHIQRMFCMKEYQRLVGSQNAVHHRAGLRIAGTTKLSHMYLAKLYEFNDMQIGRQISHGHMSN